MGTEGARKRASSGRVYSGTWSTEEPKKGAYWEPTLGAIAVALKVGHQLTLISPGADTAVTAVDSSHRHSVFN